MWKCLILLQFSSLFIPNIVHLFLPQVFLLLVKRLASLQQHNNLKSLQQTKEIRNCRRERDRISEDKKSNESKEQNDKRNILEPTSDDHYINDKISTSTRTEKIMGSNVSSGKGLSGRRTQSQSEYDMLYGLSFGKLL